MASNYLKVVLGLFPFLVSCSTKQLAPAEYVRFVEDKDNGFVRETVIDQWTYRAKYKPAGYIYLQESGPQKASSQALKERCDQLKDWVFFNVYVQHETVKRMSPLRLVCQNLEEYNEALDHYLNLNQRNFQLITSKDTLYPELYVFENSYNLSPQDVFVVGFRTGVTGKQDGMTLAYHDELLRNGIVKFRFEAEQTAAEPIIKF